jgi:uncharacterized protein
VQSCNLACQYCVVEGNVEDPTRRDYASADKPIQIRRSKDARPHVAPPVEEPEAKDFMTPEVAEAAIQKYAQLIRKSRPTTPRVTFYGGEPLLNLPTIYHGVPLVRAIEFPGQAKPEPVQILVITNGQIYQPELTSFFKKYRVTISVSLDGLPEHHDAARVTKNGKGTYERAAESLRRYLDAGINCGICTTIGTHNYRDLPEIVDHFADQFGVPVELQVPFDIPFDGGSKYYLPMRDAAPFAMEAFERLRKRGLMEGLATRRLMQVARGVFHHRDCSAVGGQMVVAPDGMMGPCHSLVGERTYFEGDVRDPAANPLTMENFKEWHGRQPVRMKECHGCSAIGICGGGCPYNALVAKGSIWKKDPQQCDYMEYMIDWIIDDVWTRCETVEATRKPIFTRAFTTAEPRREIFSERM